MLYSTYWDAAGNNPRGNHYVMSPSFKTPSQLAGSQYADSVRVAAFASAGEAEAACEAINAAWRERAGETYRDFAHSVISQPTALE